MLHRLIELIRDLFELPSIGGIWGGGWRADGVSRWGAVRKLWSTNVNEAVKREH